MDPWMKASRELRAMYQEKPSKARRQSAPVSAAPTQTSRNRVFAFGMKYKTRPTPKMRMIVAAWRNVHVCSACSQLNRRSITPNHDASATWIAVTRIRPTTITSPAATSIRNDTMRCLRKLRCFSTPHASLTALVMAPKTPGDAHLDARLAEGIELRGDEVEPRRKVTEDKGEDGEPLLLAGGHRPEQRDDEQEKGKEREERVVRDGRCVREVVAVDELDQPTPGGAACQAELLRRSHGRLWLRAHG